MFSSSIMCVNQLELKDYIDLFNKYNFGMLHIDIMDGRFVRNIMYGPYIISDLRKYTDLKFDIHLMIDKPEYKADMFDFKKTDRVTLHYESSKNLIQAVSTYKKLAGEVYVAINPATPVHVLEEIVSYIDGVLLMCVNPGFYGQQLLPNIPKKIEKLINFLPSGKGIEIDGHVTDDLFVEYSHAGVKDFVLGTSMLFKGTLEKTENKIIELKEYDKQ